MLFSEPKIPQFTEGGEGTRCAGGFQCSSASRKFLNGRARPSGDCDVAFQCSSASRKFLNSVTSVSSSACGACFSALQRAENSSISLHISGNGDERWFQCSSASRKFLNRTKTRRFSGTIKVRFQCSSASRKFLNTPTSCSTTSAAHSFSALQRAENSSIVAYREQFVPLGPVSVLFSEPKIPQSAGGR